MSDRDGEGSNPWIRTATGERFYYLSDDGAQYDLDVVASALSRVCRFGGHLREEHADYIYSVAQHSVYVFRLLLKKGAPVETLPWAILHDAPEAFFMDLVSPLKGLLPDYIAMENRSAEAMRKYHGVPYSEDIHHKTKWADYQMYFAERLVLTDIPEGEEDLTPYPEYTMEELDPDFYLWRPRYARDQYKLAVKQAFELYKGHGYANAS